MSLDSTNRFRRTWLLLIKMWPSLLNASRRRALSVYDFVFKAKRRRYSARAMDVFKRRTPIPIRFSAMLWAKLMHFSRDFNLFGLKSVLSIAKWHRVWIRMYMLWNWRSFTGTEWSAHWLNRVYAVFSLNLCSVSLVSMKTIFVLSKNNIVSIFDLNKINSASLSGKFFVHIEPLITRKPYSIDSEGNM